jgi:3-keto-5-aminohexanoate cleavage enzyme
MEEAVGKNWLEVALNGPWTKKRQPGIPVSVADIVEQGIACVNAGASIVHVHAYDEKTGEQKDDAEIYAKIIGGIRSKVDAIVYPTMPASGINRVNGDLSAEQRYAHVEALASQGMLEWMAIDPGSVNFAHYDELKEDRPGFVYVNSEEHIRHALAIAHRYGLHPTYAIYEPGFARLGANLSWRADCPDPVYRFMLSAGFTFSFPPEDYALTAYLNLLDQIAPGSNWMISGFDVDILPLIPRTVMERGHVRVGLEDAPFGCGQTNVELVEEAGKLIENAGGTLATAADVRIASSTDALESA